MHASVQVTLQTWQITPSNSLQAKSHPGDHLSVLL